MNRCHVCGSVYGHRQGCGVKQRERERRAGVSITVLLADDYPYEIDARSVRGVYGDGSPWVQWLLTHDPQTAQMSLSVFRVMQGAHRFTPPKLRKAKR